MISADHIARHVAAHALIALVVVLALGRPGSNGARGAAATGEALAEVLAA
jgi:hypothetical protein